MLISKASLIGEHETIRLLSTKEMRNFWRCPLFTWDLSNLSELAENPKWNLRYKSMHKLIKTLLNSEISSSMDTRLNTQVEFKQSSQKANSFALTLSSWIISIDTFERLLIEVMNRFKLLLKNCSNYSVRVLLKICEIEIATITS